MFKYFQNKPPPDKFSVSGGIGYQTTNYMHVTGVEEIGHGRIHPKDSVPGTTEKRPNITHVGDLFNASQDSSDEGAGFEDEFEYQYEDNVSVKIIGMTEFEDPSYTDLTDAYQNGSHVLPLKPKISSMRPQLLYIKQIPATAVGNTPPRKCVRFRISYGEF